MSSEKCSQMGVIFDRWPYPDSCFCGGHDCGNRIVARAPTPIKLFCQYKCLLRLFSPFDYFIDAFHRGMLLVLGSSKSHFVMKLTYLIVLFIRQFELYCFDQRLNYVSVSHYHYHSPRKIYHKQYLGLNYNCTLSYVHEHRLLPHNLSKGKPSYYFY